LELSCVRHVLHAKYVLISMKASRLVFVLLRPGES